MKYVQITYVFIFVHTYFDTKLKGVGNMGVAIKGGWKQKSF